MSARGERLHQAEPVRCDPKSVPVRGYADLMKAFGAKSASHSTERAMLCTHTNSLAQMRRPAPRRAARSAVVVRSVAAEAPKGALP